MGEGWNNVVLGDTADNLKNVQASFRVLRDCLMVSPERCDVPYLEAREAMYRSAVLKAMEDIGDIIQNISGALEGDEDQANTVLQHALDNYFGDPRKDALWKEVFEIVQKPDSEEYRELKALLRPESMEAEQEPTIRPEG